MGVEDQGEDPAKEPSQPQPECKLLQVSIRIADGASIADVLSKTEQLGEVMQATVGPYYGGFPY